MGRMTRDPEMRRTGSGVAVANFTVAVDRDFTDKQSGEKETDFIDCVAWRQTGEFVSKYFGKGRTIVVDGRLQIRSYTDKDGNKRRAAEVVADHCYFGDSKNSNNDNAYPASNYAPPAATSDFSETTALLKSYGYKIAILSGGFTFFGEYIQKKYGIDYVYANELEVDETGHLTGNYVGEVVDGKRKAELLRLIAQVEKVDMEQTIAVGDGANDLPMLSAAGLGIAFHAKPRVVANARQSINTIGLDGVLYFLGFKDSYLDAKAQ